jgi:predicted RNase H-like nuclease (RuvC/YqgF family)
VVTELLVEWFDDELRVSWSGGEDPTVFVSPSAEDAGTVIVPVSTPGRLRIAGLPPGFPVFVHVLDLDGRWTVGPSGP